MSNRTDYARLVEELTEMFQLSPEAAERIETELHNAHVAGEEGSGPCLCRWCYKGERLPNWSENDFARLKEMLSQTPGVTYRILPRQEPPVMYAECERDLSFPGFEIRFDFNHQRKLIGIGGRPLPPMPEYE